VKLIALLLCAATLSVPQERQGTFDIRFGPTAVLQTKAQVPFEIRVSDARHSPVTEARVTLQIETVRNTNVQVFKAPELDRRTNPGVYMAKPVFPEAGEWNVYVEVRRDDQMSARTIQFTVPD
jgi:hypothetical protein